jgi:hypothetical protein
MKRPKYYVLTYDPEKEEFTPQKGVRQGPYTLFGLRKPLRKLENLGYGPPASKSPCVLINRVD